MKYEGWMSAKAYAAIPEHIRDREDFQFQRITMDAAIRATLEKACMNCLGVGQVQAPRATYTCPQCNGTGKQLVAGARLEPRGSHVECK